MDKEIQAIIDSIAFNDIEKHPNILIAARFWDERRFHAAKVCYKFMRMIDDYIDDRKAKDEAISCLEKEVLAQRVNDWIACLVMNPDHDPLIAELIQTIETYKIPLELFHNFAKSMLFDIDHNGFSTLDEFLEYAEGASVAPASVFVHLCCLREENGEYIAPDVDVIAAARPCAIFSYIVHIIRDFQDDQLHNLNYFALDILEKNKLNTDDLKAIANGSPLPPSFRNVIAEYRDLARKYEKETLQEIEKLSGILDGRNLFSLHLIYHLYKQVYKRIDVEQGSFTSQELNPTPQENREAVLELASDWN